MPVTILRMDPVRLGRTIRAIRTRRAWRQADLAKAAGVSQGLISLLERGHARRLAVRTIERVLAELEADFHLVVRWRGGDVDRLLDEGHAAVVAVASDLLKRVGWEVAVEVTFAIYADRGSMDVLAWHPATRTLLVVEVKTELTSIEETLRTLDMKARRAREVAADRLGWRGVALSRLLVLPDTSTSRRRVARHDEVLLSVFPIRGPGVRAWLTSPAQGAGMLAFLPVTNGGRGRCGPVSRRRVRGPSQGPPERGAGRP